MIQSTSTFADALRAAKADKAAGKPKEAQAIQAAHAEVIKKEDRAKLNLMDKWTLLSEAGKTKLAIAGSILMVVLVYFKKKAIRKKIKS